MQCVRKVLIFQLENPTAVTQLSTTLCLSSSPRKEQLKCWNHSRLKYNKGQILTQLREIKPLAKLKQQEGHRQRNRKLDAEMKCRQVAQQGSWHHLNIATSVNKAEIIFSSPKNKRVTHFIVYFLGSNCKVNLKPECDDQIQHFSFLHITFISTLLY